MKVAALQMNSGADVAANFAAVERAAQDLAQQNVDMLLLPENALFMGRRESDKLAVAEPAGQGPWQAAMADLAARCGLDIVLGSFPLTAGPDKVWPACLVFGADGQLKARYDKIHLFDVQLEDGRSFCESRYFAAGEPRAVCFDCQGHRIGLSICYDLRFPELYRDLVEQGADVLLVPAAFTWATGQAHWETLLRARAIENLAAVVAANQCGEHPNAQTTWGHSMILDAWGQSLAEADSAPGWIVADLDLQKQARRREQFPVLQHRRLPMAD